MPVAVFAHSQKPGPLKGVSGRRHPTMYWGCRLVPTLLSPSTWGCARSPVFKKNTYEAVTPA